jgi:hypothetical protein
MVQRLAHAVVWVEEGRVRKGPPAANVTEP